MIRIATLQCRARHCVRAKAYESTCATIRIEAQVSAEAPSACPECGSKGPFTVKHSDTAFATMDAAVVHVAKLNRVGAAKLN